MFKVFDADRDGKLSRSEVVVMLRCMMEVSRQTGSNVANDTSYRQTGNNVANDTSCRNDASLIDENNFEMEVDVLMRSGTTSEDRDNQNISSEFLSIEDYLV